MRTLHRQYTSRNLLCESIIHLYIYVIYVYMHLYIYELISLTNSRVHVFNGSPVPIYIYNLSCCILYSIDDNIIIIDGRSWFDHKSMVDYS
jgi:hypothetical protein